MVSERKLAANRRNAQRSTGPKTPAGKAAVRYNALKHGLLAKEVVVAAGDGRESQADFDQLLSELVQDLQPEGITEKLLVQRIALCHWRLRRAARYETAEICRSYGVPRSDGSEPEPSTSLLSLLASVPTLAAVPGGAAVALERTTAGIDQLLELVGDAHFEVQLHGHLFKLHQQRLLVAFGPECGSVGNTCSVYNYSLIDHDEEDEDEVKCPELLENAPPPEECKQQLLQALSDEFERLEHLRKQVAEREAAERDLDRACLALPPEQATDRLLRYETAIERQLYRAMAEFDRLQRRRGDAVTPPLPREASPN